MAVKRKNFQELGLIPPSLIVPTTGNYFFVDSNHGTAGGTGLHPEDAISTVDAAIGKCTADKGDVIYVMPGHTETISAAGTITMDIAGVTVVGLGTGSLRPTFTFSTATTATWLITAQNCGIKNCYFANNINTCQTFFAVQASGFTFEGNQVYFARSNYVASTVMSTNAALNNVTIKNNLIHGDAVANCTNALQILGGSNWIIKDNIITGNFTANLGPINNVTASCYNITIDNNILENRTALATKLIVLLSGNTGRITNNRMIFATANAATTSVTADGCWTQGNYVSSGAVIAGTLL